TRPAVSACPWSRRAWRRTRSGRGCEACSASWARASGSPRRWTRTRRPRCWARGLGSGSKGRRMSRLFAAALLAVSPAVLAGDMRPVTVNGARLEYAVSGKGDPVLLIHGSILADAFAPLARDPALGKYRLIRYHRRGFAGSGRAQGAVTIAEQAADARALLERL